jgi:MoaA/NifB/PqqE/SkfB family radical SAM enzyme
MAHALPREVPDAIVRMACSLPYRPRNCVWELTLACNLRCQHCGSRAGCRRDDELATDEALDLVAQLADLGCELVTLSGGEPLLRDDWDAVARAVAARGIPVNMVTNGTLVDAAMARRIAAAGLANVGVSIDGPPDLHDEIRGAGTYARTAGGIRRLREAGVPVAVMTTVNRRNLPLLAAVRDDAIRLGASIWRLQLGKPMGAMHGRDDLVLAPRDVLDLVPRLAAFKRAGGIAVHVGDSIGYFGPHDRVLRGRGWRGRRESWQGCQAGMNAIGIESDGGVKGCLSMQARFGDADPFREGSVRERSLAAIWFDPAAFAYNRAFSPADLTGACRACDKAGVCRGGARCVAAAATGALGEDPYCWTRWAGPEPSFARGLAQGAATAAAALMLSVAGCSGEDDAGAPDVPADTIVPDVCEGCGRDVPFADVPQVDLPWADPGPADPGAPADVAQDPGVPSDAIDCAQVCCQCEYGIIPDEVWQACCVPSDAGANDPGPAKDPGADAVPADPGLPSDAIDCADVCCECDYGILPQAVWEACCVPPDAGANDPGPATDPGPADATADAYDCADVCCACEYGVLPEGVYEECCVKACENVCCECDYGTPPPPQCCPSAAKKS